MSRQPSPDYDRSRKPKTVEYVSYLGSMITNDARRTPEIKSRIAMVKAAVNKKKSP
jgi:hypothetical protein